MDFWKSIAGMLEVELSSAEPNAAFGIIIGKEIPVFEVQQISELTARFLIYRKDYGRLQMLCEKRGETLRICRRRGLYWSGKNILNRPIFLIGTVIFLALVLFLPTRVFFVRVEGNRSIPDRKILEAAEKSGIQFGASRREVRSEKIKNALLQAVPELQWAGVNTSGCVAVISVRERSIQTEEESQPGISSIVAAHDGIISSCTVTRGNTLVSVGQAVKAGQVLVSAYTDCGICIQATRAEGEIFAQTNRELTAVTLSECAVRNGKSETQRKYSLLIGKKRINLWKDSGIWDTTCDRMYEEYYITLPGGFQLPVALCVEEYTFYETASFEIPQEDAEAALLDFGRNYLTEQMLAGSILNMSQTVSAEDGIYCLHGNYVCTEMIGRVQREQIGEENGKSD